MAASLRFSGLTEIAGNGSVFTSINFERPFFVDPDTSRCSEWREGRSRLRRVAGLNGQSGRVAFSWPRTSARETDGGTGLPESGDGPKTRFRGLLGDSRDRDKGRVTGFALEERTESLMLGLKGVPVVWSWGGADCAVGENGPASKAGVAGTVAKGVWSNCALDDGVGDCRKTVDLIAGDDAIPESLNLEGDRDSDLRSDRTVEPTST
jgi:hypothetical protein